MNWLMFLLHSAHGLARGLLAPLVRGVECVDSFYLLRVRPLWAPLSRRLRRKRHIAFLRRSIQSPPPHWNDASIARAREALAVLERAEEVDQK